MPIAIDKERQQYIDDKFIGFSPNTSSIKPVHLANGMFRSVVGHTFDTELLNRFVFWQKNDGEVPKGHELDTIFDRLLANQRLDPTGITKDDLKRLRVLLKDILNADNGVYMHKDKMESYSAGYQAFLSEDRIAQDGGELITAWLKERHSPLLDYMQQNLAISDDAITYLSYPLLGEPLKNVPVTLDPDLPFLYHTTDLPQASQKLWAGLTHAASTLSQHLFIHPNKLFGLRLTTLFAAFVLIRHLASLESYYVPSAEDNIVPFLLDFSESSSEPVAHASLMSYTRVCQSISRFYGWAFAERLKQITSLEQLPQESAPTYRNKPLSAEAREIWQLAMMGIAETLDPYLSMGQALYDAMAQDAEANPIIYLRQLGKRSGLLWPPVNTQPSKRFVVQQDMLEVLIRGVLVPGESVTLPDLQERLWSYYGLVIGGRSIDEVRLLQKGIYQADSTALKENQRRFAQRLGQLDFARLLADGVLQVTLES